MILNRILLDVITSPTREEIQRKILMENLVMIFFGIVIIALITIAIITILKHPDSQVEDFMSDANTMGSAEGNGPRGEMNKQLVAKAMVEHTRRQNYEGLTRRR